MRSFWPMLSAVMAPSFFASQFVTFIDVIFLVSSSFLKTNENINHIKTQNLVKFSRY